MRFSLKIYSKNFVNFFFLKKEGIGAISFFLFLYSLTSLIQLFFSNDYSDEKKIILAVCDGLLALLYQVLFYNYYFSKLSERSFSLRKAMWDIPKFLSSCFQLFLWAIVGAAVIFFGFSFLSKELSIVLVIIFLAVFLAHFCYVPMIDILFDHYKINFGPYKKVRSLIKVRPSLYSLCLFFVLIATSVELLSDELLLSLGLGQGVNLVLISIESLFSITISAFVINYFFEASTLKDQVES